MLMQGEISPIRDPRQVPRKTNLSLAAL